MFRFGLVVVGLLVGSVLMGCVGVEPATSDDDRNGGAETSDGRTTSDGAANGGMQNGGTLNGGADQGATRKFSFNGHPATARDMTTLAQIEKMYGKPVPAGEYWYDVKSGAGGQWGGPTLGFLQAGLDLGGPMPANASGGGDGSKTGTFVNGRELHSVDVQVLMSIYGQVLPGRWWVDGQGNAGQEGGPVLMNLVQLAQQKGGGASSFYRTDGKGNNAFVGGGCVTVSTSKGGYGSGTGMEKTTTDYYSAGC